MTPDEIYVRAVAAARAETSPAFVAYRASYAGAGAVLSCTDGRIVVTFEGRSSAGAYRVSYRSSDDTARSIDLSSNAPCAGAPLIQPVGGDIERALGPAIAPHPIASAPPGLRAIATVRVSAASHYAVLAATPDTIGEVSVYHLALRALTDPLSYPLTDLYVDTETFLIRRVVGTFGDRYGGVPATIVATGDFARVGAYWIQTHEHVEFEARTSPKTTRATLDATASDITFSADGS